MTQLKTPKGIIIDDGDHGLKERHLELIDKSLAGWDGAFTIMRVELKWHDWERERTDRLKGWLSWGWRTESQVACADHIIPGEFGPRKLDPLQCGLHGPAAGDEPITEDEVTYEKRGNRPGPSRLIDRPTRDATHLVIVAGPGSDEPIVYTAYGTRGDIVAPREWWDSSMKPLEAIESAQFWSQHALSKED